MEERRWIQIVGARPEFVRHGALVHLDPHAPSGPVNLHLQPDNRSYQCREVERGVGWKI